MLICEKIIISNNTQKHPAKYVHRVDVELLLRNYIFSCANLRYQGVKLVLNLNQMHYNDLGLLSQAILKIKIVFGARA